MSETSGYITTTTTTNNNNNSVALVRERTISTERPPLVGEVLFPSLLYFLRSSGSGTWSIQPREYNCGDTLKKK
jgi:hypothetical protein